MRIAVVHSFYSSAQPSGENKVVVDQVSALREAGHEVLLLGRHTDDEEASALYPARAAAWVATGHGPDPTSRLMAFRPDVVHIHNLFPNIGRAWLARWPGPVVASVHNYRSVCSNGLLFRDGAICLECPQRGGGHAMVHGCYRGSRLATAPLAVSRRSEQRAVLERADAVVTTSIASDEVLTDLVKVPLRTVVIPNSGPDAGVPPLPASERRGWLAMGRLSPEKGFLELLADWPDAYDLTLIGDGAQEGEIRRLAIASNITVRPSVHRDELRSLLPRFTGLVFPSRWLEVAPQVVVEAMRVGLPVVAYEANGVATEAHRSGAGRSYRNGESLNDALSRVEADCDAFSSRAFSYYVANWRPEVWLTSMTALYERLVSEWSA